MSLVAVHVDANRLTQEQYNALIARLGPGVSGTMVNGGTTPHEAGFKLGVQHVLTLLRDGWSSNQ